MGHLQTTPAIATGVASPQVFLLKSLQALVVAILLAVLAGTFQIGLTTFLTFAFAGSFLIHAATRPSPKELAAAFGAGAMFALVYFGLHGQTAWYPGRWIGLPTGFAGMGSIEVLAVRWIWSEEAVRKSRFELLQNASLLAVLCIVSGIALAIALAFTPLTYDRLLLAADMKFGGPPSWVIGQLFRSHAWLSWLCTAVYNSLPLGLSVSIAAEWRMRQRGNPPAADFRWLAVTLGVVGFLMYQVCPASGPVYLMDKSFPIETPSLSGLALIASPLKDASRNAIPSLHVSWALLLFWSLRHRPIVERAIALLYLALTALATLGLGEHYLVDLMVAPAFALSVQAICTPGRAFQKQLALGSGAVITLIWLIAFRTGLALSIPPGPWMWILAALTAVVPLVLFSRMQSTSLLNANP
jgi:hypothetical protein